MGWLTVRNLIKECFGKSLKHVSLSTLCFIRLHGDVYVDKLPRNVVGNDAFFQFTKSKTHSQKDPNSLFSHLLSWDAVIQLQITGDITGTRGICSRANILGSSALQIIYHMEFFFVSVVVPRIYIIYGKNTLYLFEKEELNAVNYVSLVWHRCGFKLNLLGIGKVFVIFLFNIIRRLTCFYFPEL